MRRTVLNEGMIEEARELLADGMAQQQVFGALGVSESAWYEWQRKGRALLDAGLDSEADECTENERLYMEFAAAVEKGRAKAVQTHIANVVKAAEHSWTASAWWLERNYPQQYARRNPDQAGREEAAQNVKVYVPDNGRVDVGDE